MPSPQASPLCRGKTCGEGSEGKKQLVVVYTRAREQHIFICCACRANYLPCSFNYLRGSLIYLRGKFCSRYSKLDSGVFFDGRSLRCWAYRRFVVLRPPRLRLFKCTPFGGGFRFLMLRLIIADASATTIALSPAMLHLIITDASTTNDRYLSTWAAALFNSP